MSKETGGNQGLRAELYAGVWSELEDLSTQIGSTDDLTGEPVVRGQGVLVHSGGEGYTLRDETYSALSSSIGLSQMLALGAKPSKNLLAAVQNPSAVVIRV